MVSKSRKSKDKQDVQAICFADEVSRTVAYQDIEERRLKEWENFQKSHRTPEDQKLNRAFIDISIGDVLAGRLVIDLYDTIVPQTVERFRAVITGELGVDKGTGTKIDYLHTKLQTIDKERNLLCFGSFSLNIVPRIEDENYSLRHTERGLLTMISHGPNTARSGFGITLGPVPALDFRQVVFGKVVDGLAVLEKLEAVPVNAVGKPLNAPFITFCGVLTGRAPPGAWEKRERTPNNTPIWQSIIIEAEEENNTIEEAITYTPDVNHLENNIVQEEEPLDLEEEEEKALTYEEEAEGNDEGVPPDNNMETSQESNLEQSEEPLRQEENETNVGPAPEEEEEEEEVEEEEENGEEPSLEGKDAVELQPPAVCLPPEDQEEDV